MAEIDTSRFFTNNFPDVDPANPNREILTGSGLSQGFLKSLKFHRNKLLLKHFQEYSRVNDDDTSIYTGKSGVALLYLSIGKEAQRNKGILAEGSHDEFSDLNKIDFSAKGLELLDECLKKLKKKRVTFLCGDGGPLALAAVTTKSTDHETKLMKFLPEVTLMKGSDLPDELLFGRAGYLYSLTFVRNKKAESLITESVIQRVVDAIIESGKLGAKKGKHFPPLMYEWHDRHYLGAAHGLVGIMFLLLQNRSLIKEDVLQNHIKPTIELIKKLKFSSGNFPSSLGSDTDRLIHWCHGAPGAVHLFLEASKAFPDKNDDYLGVAKLCGDVIWQRGLLKKGYGLCHGVAGNGYAFVHLYQATGDAKYLYRAARFAEFCFDWGKHGCRIADRPLSLFEGLAGTIYFMTDLLNPQTAKFPAFYV